MVKSERRFGYVRRSDDSMKNLSTWSGRETIWKGRFNEFKPKEGKNIIRILPPTWPNPQDFGYHLYVNEQVGVDRATFLSLSKMLGQPDPIAEARVMAEKDRANSKTKAEEDAIGEYIRSLFPKHKFGVWLIDRSAEDEGPKLWAMPFTRVAQEIASMARDDNGNPIMLDDPEEGEGCDFRFEYTPKKKPEYYPPREMRLMKTSNLHEDEAVARQWLDYTKKYPIPDILNFRTYEHIKKAFNPEIGVTEHKVTNGEAPFDEETGEILEEEHRPVTTQKHRTTEPPFDGGFPSIPERPSVTANSLRARLAARAKPQVNDDDE